MQKRTFLRLLSLLCVWLCVLIPLSSCATRSDPLAVTAFLSVTLDEKEKITAKATLSLSTVQAHEGEYAFIYELRPDESVDTYTFSEKEPLDKARIASVMNFEFDLYNGIRSRLYSTFVICYENGTPIYETPRALDNPEVLARKAIAPLRENNPKGLTVSDADTAASLGTAHALIEVDLSTLSTALNTDDALLYSFNGGAYYLSSTRLAELDEQVRDSYTAGMQVTLRISASHGDLDADEANAALHRAALLEFLTARYNRTDYGVVTALLIDAPTFTAEEAAHLCSLAHKALLSHVVNGRIYVLCPTQNVAAATAYFETFGARLASESTFDWGAAISFDRSAVTAWGNKDTTVLTPDTLENFIGTLSKQSHRPLYSAVCDVTYTASDETLQAVSYAYAYAKARASDIGLFFYGAQTDDATGLYRTDGTARLISEFFREIDTGPDSEKLHICRAVSDTVGNTVEALKTTRTVLSGTGSVGEGTGKETSLFDFTTGTLHGFSAVGGSALSQNENPLSCQSSAYGTPVLYTWLNTAKCENGVRKILSDGTALQDATAISVQTLAQYGQASTQDCRLTLRLQGVDKNGRTIWLEATATAQAHTWQSVNFNIAAFTTAADLSRPVVVTLLVDSDQAAEDGAPENFGLWIRSISVHRPKNNYTLFFIILFSVLGIAVGSLVFLYFYRRTARHR